MIAWYHFLLKVATCFLLTTSFCFSQTIYVQTLKAKPSIDGSEQEWKGIDPTSITLTRSSPQGTASVYRVDLKAGVYEDSVYFYAQWKDTTESMMHRPFIWSDDKGRYIKGPQQEDRLALQFEMSGNYSTNWVSGEEFSADMWHWKSSRSNPLGLAHDKMTVITKSKQLGSIKLKLPNGPIYIKRPSDAGDKIYKSTRYGKKIEDTMPKYQLADNPQGSIADVKAKGVWKNDFWHLEMKRKLNTGHVDDVVFKVGSAIKGGIAIFNATSDEDHTISDTLVFQF